MPAVIATKDEVLAAWQSIILERIKAAGLTKTEKTTDRILSEVLWDALWAVRSPYAYSTELMAKYVWLDVIDHWLSSVWRDVDFDETVSEQLEQMGLSLNRMRDGVVKEIDFLTKRYNAGLSGGSLSGTATRDRLSASIPVESLTSRRGERYPVIADTERVKSVEGTGPLY